MQYLKKNLSYFRPLHLGIFILNVQFSFTMFNFQPKLHEKSVFITGALRKGIDT